MQIFYQTNIYYFLTSDSSIEFFHYFPIQVRWKIKFRLVYILNFTDGTNPKLIIVFNVFNVFMRLSIYIKKIVTRFEFHKKISLGMDKFKNLDITIMIYCFGNSVDH